MCLWSFFMSSCVLYPGHEHEEGDVYIKSCQCIIWCSTNKCIDDSDISCTHKSISGLQLLLLPTLFSLMTPNVP